MSRRLSFYGKLCDNGEEGQKEHRFEVGEDALPAWNECNHLVYLKMALKVSPSKRLHQDIAALLVRLLQQEATVTYQDTMIKVEVTADVFQHRFGEVLHRIQQAIDEQFPVRTEDVSVLVRDSGSRFEHVFKIWKTDFRT